MQETLGDGLDPLGFPVDRPRDPLESFVAPARPDGEEEVPEGHTAPVRQLVIVELDPESKQTLGDILEKVTALVSLKGQGL